MSRIFSRPSQRGSSRDSWNCGFSAAPTFRVRRTSAGRSRQHLVAELYCRCCCCWACSRNDDHEPSKMDDVRRMSDLLLRTAFALITHAPHTKVVATCTTAFFACDERTCRGHFGLAFTATIYNTAAWKKQGQF